MEREEGLCLHVECMTSAWHMQGIVLDASAHPIRSRYHLLASIVLRRLAHTTRGSGVHTFSFSIVGGLASLYPSHVQRIGSVRSEAPQNNECMERCLR